jgi:hypothetical protein
VSGDRGQILRCARRQVLVAAHDHLADHSLQAHALAVLGAVDACDAIALQVADLRRHDHTAPAAEDLDVLAAALTEQVHRVLEILDMPALVRADRDALRVLLQRGRHHFVDGAVVAEVDHLGAHAHQDAPHDVDRGVVSVEQCCRGDESNLGGGAVLSERLEFSGQVGHGKSPLAVTLGVHGTVRDDESGRIAWPFLPAGPGLRTRLRSRWRRTPSRCTSWQPRSHG